MAFLSPKQQLSIEQNSKGSLQCFDAVGSAAGRASGLEKNWVVGCWRGYVSGSQCRFAYGPADANAIHYLLLQKIQIGFTFLVPAHLGSPGQNPRGPQNGCVCVWRELKKLNQTKKYHPSISSFLDPLMDFLREEHCLLYNGSPTPVPLLLFTNHILIRTHLLSEMLSSCMALDSSILEENFYACTYRL